MSGYFAMYHSKAFVMLVHVACHSLMLHKTSVAGRKRDGCLLQIAMRPLEECLVKSASDFVAAKGLIKLIPNSKSDTHQ